jgi:hypothetical protein
MQMLAFLFLYIVLIKQFSYSLNAQPHLYSVSTYSTTAASGLAFDSNGDFFVATFSGIYKVNAGTASEFVGQPSDPNLSGKLSIDGVGTFSSFIGISSISVDVSDNSIYLSDKSSSNKFGLIRRIRSSGRPWQARRGWGRNTWCFLSSGPSLAHSFFLFFHVLSIR